MYPSCFPKDFETAILPTIDDIRSIEVYRVIKSGTIHRNDFLSTYEEVILNLIPKPKNYDERDPGTYSTSCYMDSKEIEYFLKLIMKHHPPAVIAQGKTEVKCGPSQITKERNPAKKDTHVDWWIFEAATPELYFRKVV